MDHKTGKSHIRCLPLKGDKTDKNALKLMTSSCSLWKDNVNNIKRVNTKPC